MAGSTARGEVDLGYGGAARLLITLTGAGNRSLRRADGRLRLEATATVPASAPQTIRLGLIA